MVGAYVALVPLPLKVNTGAPDVLVMVAFVPEAFKLGDVAPEVETVFCCGLACADEDEALQTILFSPSHEQPDANKQYNAGNRNNHPGGCSAAARAPAGNRADGDRGKLCLLRSRGGSG
jgi:hypothetical protein